MPTVTVNATGHGLNILWMLTALVAGIIEVVTVKNYSHVHKIYRNHCSSTWDVYSLVWAIGIINIVVPVFTGLGESFYYPCGIRHIFLIPIIVVGIMAISYSNEIPKEPTCHEFWKNNAEILMFFMTSHYIWFASYMILGFFTWFYHCFCEGFCCNMGTAKREANDRYQRAENV
jgi:hypothetical protein